VPSPEPLLSPIALAADASIEVNGASTGTSLNYMVGATVTGTLTSGHQLFQLGAAYLVAFVTPPDLQPTPEEVTAFGNVSVVSIVYPYLRQLVADMTGRSGLPALTIAAHRTPFVNDLLETESVEA
jgi:preprotein translocase subunit SecB